MSLLKFLFKFAFAGIGLITSTVFVIGVAHNIPGLIPQEGNPEVLSSYSYEATPTAVITPEKTFYISKPTIDPDPMTTCNFQYIPSRVIRTSACKASTECQIGNAWYFYDNASKCKEDQEKDYKVKMQQIENSKASMQQALDSYKNTLLAPLPTGNFDASNAISQMQAIANEPITTKPIDGTIHMIESPENTPVVPYGFGN